MAKVSKNSMTLPSFISDVEFDFDSHFYVNSSAFRTVTITEFSRNSLDFIAAVFMLILLLPLLLIVSIIIKLKDRGPIFYSQIRVGKNGKEFSIYKFRTMIVDAEKKTGAVLATDNDNRITKIGNFLRKSHIDELPQLLNVLKGDMGFVGPRPERPVFVNDFDKTIPLYIRRKEVRPGISGLAQICLPYNATADQKIKYDLIYIDNKSYVLFSVMIAFYTLKKMTFFKNFNT